MYNARAGHRFANENLWFCPMSLKRPQDPRASCISKHQVPYITQAPARSSRLLHFQTPSAPYYSSARKILAPLAFPNTKRPILLKRPQDPRASCISKHQAPHITQAPTRSSRLLHFQTPSALYYSSARKILAPLAFPNTKCPILLKRPQDPRASCISKHQAPHITQAPARSSRLLHFQTPSAPYYSSARKILAPLAFPNTKCPILLKRPQDPRASCISKHQAPHITQAPARSSRLLHFQTPSALYYSSARKILAPLAFPNTKRPILLKRPQDPRTSCISKHQVPYITQAPTRSSRLLHFQTPSALCHSSARKILAPLAFPNTKCPILLKRPQDPRASCISKHQAPHITQAPARSSRLLHFQTPSAPYYSSARKILAPLAFPNTKRPILLKRPQDPRTSCISKHQAPHITQAPARSSRLLHFQTPSAPYYSSARKILAPLAFPNTKRPILLKRPQDPRTSCISKHQAPHITQAPARSSHLLHFQTPSAPYYSSARKILAPLAFSKHQAPHITQASGTQANGSVAFSFSQSQKYALPPVVPTISGHLP